MADISDSSFLKLFKGIYYQETITLKYNFVLPSLGLTQEFILTAHKKKPFMFWGISGIGTGQKQNGYGVEVPLLGSEWMVSFDAWTSTVSDS